MNVQIIRSQRKTRSMTLKPEGLVVRAPLRASDQSIQQFIDSHRSWINKAVARQEQQKKELAGVEPLSDAEIRQLAEQALAYIPERVRHYAPLVGVTYRRITIRNQKSRWGSCSAKGNLNFNCLLMLTPPEVIDSVVVHELCHREAMSHSDQFYQEVLRVFPHYWNQHKWLKEHGEARMRRMTG